MKKYIWLVVFLVSNCTKTEKITLVAEPKDPIIVPAPVSTCPAGGFLINGAPVCNGLTPSIGIDVSSSTSCLSGGHVIKFFNDLNRNNLLDSPEEPILSLLQICNGLNGSDGIVSVEPASLEICPNGGVLINGNPICNSPAIYQSGVFAAKLCPTDNDPLAEYGIFVDGNLYAVLYSSRTSHPHTIGLVRVLPGTYETTTTTSVKIFTYSKTDTSATLTCEGVSVTYDLFSGEVIGGGSSSGSVSGASCVVQLVNSSSSQKTYQTTVSGSGISNNYRITYKMNNNSYNSQHGCKPNFGFMTDNTCNVSNYTELPNRSVRFTPISGALSYNVTIKGNSSLIIEKAEMLIISTGQVVNCSVIQ